MTDEDMMVAIPVEEYEHLKECEKLLNLAFAERIKKANDEVSQMLTKGEVNMLSVFLQDADLDHAIDEGDGSKFNVTFEVEKKCARCIYFTECVGYCSLHDRDVTRYNGCKDCVTGQECEDKMEEEDK